MKLLKYKDFLLEYVKYSDFKGALKFGNWSEFKKKLETALNKGFSTIDELLLEMEMDKNFYDNVKNNMIYHWQDSVSKSLLHGISNVDLEMPEEGDVIFKDPKTQTRFLVVAGPGHSSRDFFGNTNMTSGLNQWGMPSLIDTETGRNSMFIKNDTNYTLHSSKLEKLDKVLQYVWIYVFYNEYLRKKQNIKMPKWLYRGIRSANLYNHPIIRNLIEGVKRSEDKQDKFSYDKMTTEKIDIIIKYILENGIQELIEGNYLSFTSSRAVAEYFANDEGFLIRVDPKKVRVVTSPLTDETFGEYNYLSNRKEMEYIVRLPENYKFNKEDIIISSEEYYVGANSPLAVPFFGHDDKKANYDMYVPEQDKTYQIEAWYSWTSNTSGKVYYKISLGGEELTYAEGPNNIKKRFGFDPVPKEDNLKYISNFKISPKERW